MNRRSCLVTLLAGLAVGTAAWWAVPGEAPPAPPAQAPATVVAAAGPVAAALPQPPAAGVAALAPPAVVPEQPVELCGIGRMPLQGRGLETDGDAFERLPDPLGRLALQELQERLLRVLAAGDARQRVAAWLLRQPEVADPPVQAAWAAGLLAEARAGGDTQALRWAAAACGHTEDAARCRRELAQARIDAEPDNGLHWLEWAQEVSGEPEQAEAWWSLVHARRWQAHPGGLTAVTQQALAALQPAPAGYLRARLARETQGREAAQAPSAPAWLEQRCARQHGDCAQLAGRLRDRADSAALLQQAVALGRQLGWGEDDLQALTAATQGFHAGLPRWEEAGAAVLACTAAEAQLAHAQAVARRGEVARAP